MRASDSRNPVALSVITTCLNEQDNLDLLVQRTLRTFDKMDISAEFVLIDDGSTDRTWSLLERWAEREQRIRGFRHDVNRGIEAAWRTGLAGARGSLVCLIDADLQNRPEDIATLYQTYHDPPLADGRRADVVQGTRRPVNPPWARHLLSRGLNLILNATFNMRLSDNKSGFVLCRREVLDAMLRHRFSYRYYQCFLAAAAHARGFAIEQVDTVFEPRTGGRSFLRTMPLSTVGRILWEIIKARVDLGRSETHAAGAMPPCPTHVTSVLKRS